MKKFRKRCEIPKIWCGNGENPGGQYKRKGTRTECLRKGFGVGAAIERKKTLPKNSLQHIYYVGPKFEAKFKKNGIKSTKSLLKKANNLSKPQLQKLLTKICKNKSGNIDRRVYNSVIIFLLNNNITMQKLPKCKKIHI